MSDPNQTKRVSPVERLVVRSNGRLHFGLSEICPAEPNCFAGIGLMINHATAEMEAVLSNCQNQGPSSTQCSIIADDYWSPRIRTFFEFWEQSKKETSPRSFPFASLALRESPSPHCGLGSGTQMACSLALLLATAERIPTTAEPTHDVNFSMEDFSIADILRSDSSVDGQSTLDLQRSTLAKLSNRGKRSNIGLHGFIEGGFLIDHGHVASESDEASDSKIIRKTDREEFPVEWPIILVQHKNSTPGDSGSAEIAMFERCSRHPNPNRARMLKMVSDEIVPSIKSKDWQAFDLAIGQYGQLAGQLFEPVQGGIYRTTTIAETVNTITKLGIQGAVQSSWGPTISVVLRDQDHAVWCQQQLRELLTDTSVTIVQASNSPARVYTS